MRRRPPLFFNRIGSEWRCPLSQSSRRWRWPNRKCRAPRSAGIIIRCPTEQQENHSVKKSLPAIISPRAQGNSGMDDRFGRAYPLAEKMIFLARPADQIFRRQFEWLSGLRDGLHRQRTKLPSHLLSLDHRAPGRNDLGLPFHSIGEVTARCAFSRATAANWPTLCFLCRTNRGSMAWVCAFGFLSPSWEGSPT